MPKAEVGEAREAIRPVVDIQIAFGGQFPADCLGSLCGPTPVYTASMDLAADVLMMICIVHRDEHVVRSLYSFLPSSRLGERVKPPKRGWWRDRDMRTPYATRDEARVGGRCT